MRLAAALAQDIPVMYNNVVKRVRYCASGVEVDTEGFTYAGMPVLCVVIVCFYHVLRVWLYQGGMSVYICLYMYTHTQRMQW